MPVKAGHNQDVDMAHWIPWLAAGLLLARLAGQLWLERLNRREVLAHAGAVPAAFRAIVDEATYARAVQYTLAQGRLDRGHPAQSA